MASENFYITVGLLSAVTTFTGLAMLSGRNNSPEVLGAAFLIFLIGILMGLVVAGAFFFDAKKRVKGWNIEKRYDDLETKEQEINLKKREREVREKEEQLKRENIKRRQQQQQSEQAMPMPDRRKNKDSDQSNKPKNEEQKSDLLESSKEKKVKDDNYILKTGQKVPDNLKQKQTPDIPEESVFTDTDYAKAISDSIPLKALWRIYREPDKYRNINQLYDNFGEEFDRRRDLYDVFKKEEFKKLISNIDERERTEGFTLSSLGAKLIKIARKEKIFGWREFVDKFSL